MTEAVFVVLFLFCAPSLKAHTCIAGMSDERYPLIELCKMDQRRVERIWLMNNPRPTRGYWADCVPL